MFSEPSGKHHSPHFHVYYQAQVAIYSIYPVEKIAGSLFKRQARFVEAWAEIHQEELFNCWNKLQAGQLPEPIQPLT
jgi:hypothetical protein